MVSGASGIELETPKSLWIMLRLSSLCVPNVITFPQTALWADIELRNG